MDPRRQSQRTFNVMRRVKSWLRSSMPSNTSNNRMFRVIHKRRIHEMSTKDVVKEFVEINEQRKIYFGQFEWLIVSNWWTFDITRLMCVHHSNSSVIIVFFKRLEFVPPIATLYSNPRAPPALACPLPMTVSGASAPTLNPNIRTVRRTPLSPWSHRHFDFY